MYFNYSIKSNGNIILSWVPLQKVAIDLVWRLRLQILPTSTMRHFPCLQKKSVAVFVLSSYGEGEPTDNVVGSFDFMTQDPIFSDSEQLDCPLQDITYVAFGLGNSTCEHYNRVVRKVDSVLQSLGANKLTYVGEGDDAQETAEDLFISWKDALWQFLRELKGLEEREALFEPLLVVTPYPPDTQGHS